MRFRRSEDMKAAEFDLTPMIDVILLLIIFFMLSSQFARVNVKALNLPAERGEAVSESDSSHEVIINIDEAGAISVLDKPISDPELEKALASAGAGSADFVIRADRACMAERLNLVALTLVKLQVRSWKIAVASGSVEAATTGGAP